MTVEKEQLLARWLLDINQGLQPTATVMGNRLNIKIGSQTINLPINAFRSVESEKITRQR